MEKRKRINELDFFKGVAIILVVVGHFISSNWLGAVDTHPVYTWIYSFHMPLFFFISGYLISYTSKDFPLEAIRRKTFALLVPYVVWTFVLAPLYKDSQMSFNFNAFLNPNANYWFVYLLWFYSIFYYSCYFLYSKSAWGGQLFLAASIFLIWVAQHFFPCELFSRGLQFMPIYIYGVIANKMKLQDKYFVVNSIVISLLCVLFVVSSVSYMKMESVACNKLMKLIASISSCTLVLFYIKTKFVTELVDSGNKVFSPLIYAGQNSVVIYLTHFFFLNVLPYPLDILNQLHPFWAFLLALIFASVIAVVCLIVGEIVKRFVWIDRFVYGRGWS